MYRIISAGMSWVIKAYMITNNQCNQLLEDTEIRVIEYRVLNAQAPGVKE